MKWAVTKVTLGKKLQLEAVAKNIIFNFVSENFAVELNLHQLCGNVSYEYIWGTEFGS
jgi:hypothetical protein